MWADNYIERLKAGETIQFRPRGNSMSPLIKSNQLVTVEPVTFDTKIEVGDIVLCRVRKRQYLHLVIATRNLKDSPCPRHFQIGNNKGGVNGWTLQSYIYGKVIKVE